MGQLARPSGRPPATRLRRDPAGEVVRHGAARVCLRRGSSSSSGPRWARGEGIAAVDPRAVNVEFQRDELSGVDGNGWSNGREDDASMSAVSRRIRRTTSVSSRSAFQVAEAERRRRGQRPSCGRSAFSGRCGRACVPHTNCRLCPRAFPCAPKEGPRLVRVTLSALLAKANQLAVLLIRGLPSSVTCCARQATNEQDSELVGLCQKGAQSDAYEPGPYSAHTEMLVDKFCNWYVGRMRAHNAR